MAGQERILRKIGAGAGGRATFGLWLTAVVLSGCIPPPPSPGGETAPPSQAGGAAGAGPQQGPMDVGKEVYHLTRVTEDLTEAETRNRTTLSEMNQRVAFLEKELSQMRGELEIARHGGAVAPGGMPPAVDAAAGLPPEAGGVGPSPAQMAAAGTGTPAAAGAPPASATPPAAGQKPGAPAPVVAMTGAGATPPPPTAQKPPPPPAVGGAKESYDTAFTQLRAGQYAQALRGFEGFLAAHPRDEMADNAQYWVGEIHYVQQNYPDALVAFNKVLTDWPKSDKVPASLLKIGFAFHALEDKDNARASLTRLINEFPDDPTVTLAKQRLQKIDQEGAKPR